jgi:phytoene dehydrogenase-like protein
MGELEGVKGAWGYPRGGMGGVSQAIAKSAEAAGAEIRTGKPVKVIMICLSS